MKRHSQMISTSIRSYFAMTAFALLGSIVLSAPSSAAPADAAQIVIKDFMFTPNTLTIKAGATVIWANKDDEPHTVVSDTGLFRSGAVDTEETFSFKFDKPGTYHFTCSVHPRMIGTIVVE
jgi:plastocyanin